MLMLATTAHAQATLSNDKPVEISSDTLEVQQDKNQAIFSGNVLAKQGTINMRSDQMIVHYINNNANKPADGKPAPTPAPAPAGTNGVERIDASGNVIFTNPTDTAKGDFAVYNVAAQTLDLTGTVILTRDKNILKGTHMTYHMDTGRSVLTAGNGAVTTSGGAAANTTATGGRVHGLFVPQQSNTPAKPNPQPAGK